ncbi:hypothetical protein KHQ06_16835 [Nocardia tengchongensis]|uniref:site-specific DNA-methyltransferase (adenine-specific) n=1 Tax=Nocardia tengchongensis TaxID=2055889 RepID=A0ABX8CXA2_9NOCA|nr:hypothetical protein [Nocardia tengchongensis]QVI24282.1 hypothetical protein KHQ06_16835 [Nocardia tengchongensis]
MQKAKAYIALHNSYGVDLNETAVELAEVSLWLNVMHPGLQAPWFGLHLRRGNSLIGAGRKIYSAPQVLSGTWLRESPDDLPFSAGALPPGMIHHFLVPADGWGAVSGPKEAKALAPEQAKQLASWRRGIAKRISDKKTNGRKTSQLQRLQALSGRVEYLWDLVTQRLTISEREISRKIDVWGADWLHQPEHAVPKEKVYQDLTAPGTPYWRLKKVMDAWCALWFWSLDEVGLLNGSDPRYAREQATNSLVDSFVSALPADEPISDQEPTGFEQVYITDSLFSIDNEQLDLAQYTQSQVVGARKPKTARRPKLDPVRDIIPLQNLDDWLDFAESVLGRVDVPKDSLVTSFTQLEDLEKYEDQLPVWMGMDSEFKLGERFPWFGATEGIAEGQGFFHWDLQFAQIFLDGGFDLQIGNPPWVRPDWQEDAILAEEDPWFKLSGKADASEWRMRKSEVLDSTDSRTAYFGELANNSGVVEFLGSQALYPLLYGTRPDFYRAFMSRVWMNSASAGVAGLIHPDTHFGGVKEGALRAAAYRRLRLHGNFVNAANWAFEIGRTREFGVHIYGSEQDIGFDHLSQLYDARSFPESFVHDGRGDAPGQKYRGDWDRRPHRDRIIHVDIDLLGRWNAISGDPKSPADEAPLLFPVSVHEQDAIAALGAYRHRLRGENPWITSGYNEKTSKDDGRIRGELGRPGALSDVIVQPTHFGIATPFAKEPNDPFRNDKDWVAWDLTGLPESVIPRTTYVRACSISEFERVQDRWNMGSGDVCRYTRFYRLLWRRRIDPKSTERSLFAALFPPGPAHVHTVNSLALADSRGTALAAGFWAALPLDYLLRITGRADLQKAEALGMPAADPNHPLASALLLRTLRLNCLTGDYAALWRELYDPAWSNEAWAVKWSEIQPIRNVLPEWRLDTPLRSEYERRAALVEIDTIVALWLGMTADHLVAIFRGRYPILGDRESAMWFDAAGRRIAADPYAFGYSQTKDHFEKLQEHLDAEIDAPAPEGYEAPFYKADREAEYRQAHAVFAQRLADAGWPVPGESPHEDGAE